ncbi:hypothetical protein C8Q76DRAFT_389324 [Earliella scabrosa]|nr:hypothetical protein C8Q76DRAFT_389324 [Earliella scabrosa]
MPMNPITHFESSTDRGNCLFAAMVAADNNGYIHRDISPTNIILYRTPGDPMDKPRRGVLCDWDLSRARGESTLLDDYEVSATWQFQSIDTLERKPGAVRPHTVKHDMESLLYVVLYCGLLYLPHEGDQADALCCFVNMFDEQHLRRNRLEGGDGKAKNRLERTYTAEIKWVCNPLTIWVNGVMDIHSALDRDVWSPESLADYWNKFNKEHGHALTNDGRHYNINLVTQANAECYASPMVGGIAIPAPYPYNATVRAGQVRKRGEDDGLEAIGGDGPPPRTRQRHETSPTPMPNSQQFRSAEAIRFSTMLSATVQGGDARIAPRYPIFDESCEYEQSAPPTSASEASTSGFRTQSEGPSAARFLSPTWRPSGSWTSPVASGSQHSYLQGTNFTFRVPFVPEHAAHVDGGAVIGNASSSSATARGGFGRDTLASRASSSDSTMRARKRGREAASDDDSTE